MCDHAKLSLEAIRLVTVIAAASINQIIPKIKEDSYNFLPACFVPPYATVEIMRFKSDICSVLFQYRILSTTYREEEMELEVEVSMPILSFSVIYL